ncbi:MAG: hypothetical protein Q9166_006764 [cf. Caloplaca sp. 2 TL-2023]
MPSATADLNSPPPTSSKSLPPNPHFCFQRLVRDIQATLGSGKTSKGITSSDELKDILQNQLQEYESQEAGWQEYDFKDPSQTFTRNLVDRGNGNYNLVGHMFLTETRYAWPTKAGPMQQTKETTFNRDEVIYMADNLGLHKISNPDPEEYSVSLHLYTPPNAAIKGCQVFNSKTGEAKHVKSYSYYSENGRRSED